MALTLTSKRSTANVPLIAHIVLSLDVGGLENGLVNLLNHMPGCYRHVVICLSHFTDFRERIKRSDVEVIALHKRCGKDIGLYFRLWKLLRRLQPDIVHTRDYAALDTTLIVTLAGVRYRVHSLHGWRMKNTLKYKLIHRSLKCLIHRHITVSKDLAQWLEDEIGISARQVIAVCNGVDTAVFHAAEQQRGLLSQAGTQFGPGKFIVGTAGRLVPVKDQLTLVKAFSLVVVQTPALADRLRLVIVGDGPLRDDLHAAVDKTGLAKMCWLAGSRDDVPVLLRGMDLFVLPSLSEGISNTILEAMASGLPVIATNVGGSPELVSDGETGRLIPQSDPVALASAIKDYVNAPETAIEAGKAGKKRIDQQFSMDVMVAAYARVYDELLTRTEHGGLRW